MRVADVGEYTDLWTRDLDQRGNVTVMARAHLDDEHVVRLVRGLQEQLADAKLIILVLRSTEDAPAVRRRKNLREKFFGRRLAGAAGNRRDLARIESARSAREGHIRGFRLPHEHRGGSLRARLEAFEDEHRSAAPHGLRGEVMAVESLTAQGNERIARLDRSSVGARAHVAGAASP